MNSGHALAGLLVVRVVHLYADVLAACKQRCRTGATTAGEWIEHQLTRQREAANQLRQRLYRLLCRMQLVATVGHVDHVCYRLLRQRRPALGQQVRLLVLIAEEPRLRAVRLAKYDVSHRLKTRFFPGCEELIHFRPAVEHDGYTVHLEHPVRFPHRGSEPVGVRIVLDRAAIAVAVVHQVRRVGEDEVDAVGRHLVHRLDAVAMKDLVGEAIRFDEARSAATVAGRDALHALMVAAKTKPKPFDCLLVDDTSRLARYLPDVLSMNDILLYHGVFIYAVAQRLDCREKASRPLLTLHGMMDEQFLVSLGEKVHRGQEGRTLKGMHPGGKVFGYRNTPIEDPTRTGKYGRAAVSGVKLELDEAEAPIVERVFTMYANGNSLATIAKNLNAEGVQAPQPPRTRQMRAWCPSSIREMVRNERYRGVFVWNRTKKERNPETGRKTSRPRPESDWVRVEVPEWRIVSEELWARVEAQIQRVGKRWSATSIGGQGRRGRGPKHLFSGFLICGVCGSRMTIVSGNGRRGYVKYGCPSHRNRGVCANSVMIRKDRLEDQLLTELSDRLLQPAMVDYALQSFHEQLQRRLQEIRDHADSAANGVLALQGKRQELKAKATNVTEAIAAIGHSPSLLAQLATIEAEIAKLDDRLTEMNQPRDLAVSLEDLREVLHERAAEIGALLRGDVEVARLALAKYVDRLVLTPKGTHPRARFSTFPVASKFSKETNLGWGVHQ